MTGVLVGDVVENVPSSGGKKQKQKQANNYRGAGIRAEKQCEISVTRHFCVAMQARVHWYMVQCGPHILLKRTCINMQEHVYK